MLGIAEVRWHVREAVKCSLALTENRYDVRLLVNSHRLRVKLKQQKAEKLAGNSSTTCNSKWQIKFVFSLHLSLGSSCYGQKTVWWIPVCCWLGLGPMNYSEPYNSHYAGKEFFLNKTSYFFSKLTIVKFWLIVYFENDFLVKIDEPHKSKASGKRQFVFSGQIV